MNLVDEEHVVWLKRGEQSCQVAGLVEHGAGGYLKPYLQFIGYDIAEGCLAESRRAVEQCVVERLATILGCLHKHLEIVHHLVLAMKVIEGQRAQGVFVVFVG